LGWYGSEKLNGVGAIEVYKYAKCAILGTYLCIIQTHMIDRHYFFQKTQLCY